jgi:hypothetical protein
VSRSSGVGGHEPSGALVGVLTAIRSAWRCKPGRDPAGGDPSGCVRLLAAPTRPPETPIERLLVDTLAAKGPLSRRGLVSQAALALYREELAQGGWVADLGILGERPFVPDVARALEAARGVLWEIETPAGRRD